MVVLAMSRPEIDRMHVLRDVTAKRLTVNEAAQLLRLTRRQVFRRLKAYRAHGPKALVSARRGKPSNRRYPATLRTEALALIKANYADFERTNQGGFRHKHRGERGLGCNRLRALLEADARQHGVIAPNKGRTDFSLRRSFANRLCGDQEPGGPAPELSAGSLNPEVVPEFNLTRVNSVKRLG
jgi:hypothetical protein